MNDMYYVHKWMFFKLGNLGSSAAMAVFAGLLFELFHSTSPVTPPLQHRRSLVQNQSLAVLWRSTALLNVLHLVQHQIRFAGLQLRINKNDDHDGWSLILPKDSNKKSFQCTKKER